MKKGIKIVLIVFGALVGLFVLLGIIGALLPESEESGNATASESKKSSASEPAVKEKSAPTASGSTVKAGKPAPAEDFRVELTKQDDRAQGTKAGEGVVITGYTGSAKNLTIPETIEDLPVVAVDIKNIECEQIFVPEGVRYVRFENAKNLRAISLPSTVKRIEAISGSTMLTSVTIPNGVTYIGSFQGSGLRSIVIPASVKQITDMAGDGTFKGCKDLITAEISGDNLDYNWPFAFRNCEALQTAIIHEGVTQIGTGTFDNCKALRNLTLPSSLIVINGASFRGCTSLTSVVIPNGVTYIAESAFSGCTNLTSVTIPKSVTNIELNAFRNCKNLVTVDIEEGASIKGRYGSDGIFDGCDKLNLKSQAAIKAAFTR